MTITAHISYASAPNQRVEIGADELRSFAVVFDTTPFDEVFQTHAPSGDYVTVLVRRGLRANQVQFALEAFAKALGEIR